MKVRPGTILDLAEVVQLGANFHKQTAYQSISYCPESTAHTVMLSIEQGLLAVAEADNKVVGFLCGLMFPSPFNRNHCMGTEVAWWLEPAYRATRLAKELLVQAEKQAREAGVQHWTMVALDALEPERVFRIYKRMGYVPTEYAATKEL